MHESLAIVSDLIFSSRIAGTASAAGGACRTVRRREDLDAALAQGPPQLVLVDMLIEDLDPAAAIAAVRAAGPSTRIIAFFPHQQRDLAAQAQAAGADETWPRSRFVQELPGLFTPAAG